MVPRCGLTVLPMTNTQTPRPATANCQSARWQANVAQEVIIAELIIRDLDESVIARLEARAHETNRSPEDVVHDMLTATARPSREKLWAEIDAHRHQIGRIEPNAKELIREDRDSR